MFYLGLTWISTAVVISLIAGVPMPVSYSAATLQCHTADNKQDILPVKSDYLYYLFLSLRCDPTEG